MAEYVCELPVDGMVSFVSGGTTIPVREPIVRCRDCKICVKKGLRLYCDLNAGGFPEVEPDGFCAWGERREDA